MMVGNISFCGKYIALWEIYRFVQEIELKSKLRELYSRYDAGITGGRPFFLSFFLSFFFLSFFI
jgi:hypothetical protein